MLLDGLAFFLFFPAVAGALFLIDFAFLSLLFSLADVLTQMPSSDAFLRCFPQMRPKFNDTDVLMDAIVAGIRSINGTGKIPLIPSMQASAAVGCAEHGGTAAV